MSELLTTNQKRFMSKNKHAQALGKRGGSVKGGAKADASRKNLEKVSPASRIANAKKARAARAAKREPEPTSAEWDEMSKDVGLNNDDYPD
jgi:hypothetical protein